MIADPSLKTIYAKQILPHTSRKGLFTVILPNGRVASVQPDGRLEDRPAGADGEYEACQVDGHLATFLPDPSKPPFTFAVVLIDKLLS